MKKLILITAILIASMCYADDPNETITITFTTSRATWDKLIEPILYINPIPQIQVTDPNGIEVIQDQYSAKTYLKIIVMRYLNKLNIKGMERMARDEARKNRDSALAESVIAENLEQE